MFCPIWEVKDKCIGHLHARNVLPNLGGGGHPLVCPDFGDFDKPLASPPPLASPLGSPEKKKMGRNKAGIHKAEVEATSGFSSAEVSSGVSSSSGSSGIS